MANFFFVQIFDTLNCPIEAIHAAAIAIWRPLAEKGDPRALSNLGVMYENGRGVPADLAEAVRLYKLAAAQGYAPGQHNLGVMYANARGVAGDDATVQKPF